MPKKKRTKARPQEFTLTRQGAKLARGSQQEREYLFNANRDSVARINKMLREHRRKPYTIKNVPESMIESWRLIEASYRCEQITAVDLAIVVNC